MKEKEKLYRELFMKHHGTMFQFCRAFIHNETIADEIVHEAFVRLWCVWDERATYPPLLNKGWLYKTMRNIIYETQRVRNTDSINHHEHLQGDDHITEKNETLQYEHYIQEIRKHLKPSDCKLFELYVVRMLSYKEIAELLEIRESSVRSQVTRLRKRLKPIVEKILSENFSNKF